MCVDKSYSVLQDGQGNDGTEEVARMRNWRGFDSDAMFCRMKSEDRECWHAQRTVKMTARMKYNTVTLGGAQCGPKCGRNVDKNVDGCLCGQGKCE